MHNDDTLLRAFEERPLDVRSFGHRAHVQVAFEILQMYEFVRASTIYASAIHDLASAAGAPQKFNATITYAFLSIIAERMDAQGYVLAQGIVDLSRFDVFVADNNDLMSFDVLRQRFSPDRLSSDLARRVLLLPDIA